MIFEANYNAKYTARTYVKAFYRAPSTHIYTHITHSHTRIRKRREKCTNCSRNFSHHTTASKPNETHKLTLFLVTRKL